MEEKTKGQELYDHYSKTKRTPMSVPYKSTLITDKDTIDPVMLEKGKEPQFENFLLLVDECRGVERREVIMKGILQIEIHSKYLENLPLSGDELIRVRYSYDKMLLTLRQLLNKPEAKDNKIPSFEKCFWDYDFWTGLMTDPRILDKCELLENNTYKWKGTKEDLAGLAHVLNNRDKLIRTFSGQDLARIFCPYFNVDFKPGMEKSFQPDRAECDKFYYIH